MRASPLKALLKLDILVLLVKFHKRCNPSLLHNLGIDNQSCHQLGRFRTAIVVANQVMTTRSLEPASALPKHTSWVAIHFVKKGPVEHHCRDSGSGVSVRRRSRVGREGNQEANARLPRTVRKLILVHQFHRRKRSTVPNTPVSCLYVITILIAPPRKVRLFCGFSMI